MAQAQFNWLPEFGSTGVEHGRRSDRIAVFAPLRRNFFEFGDDRLPINLVVSHAREGVTG